MKRFRGVAIAACMFSAGISLADGQGAQKPSAMPDSKPSAPTAVPVAAPEPKPGAQIEKLLRALQGTWSIQEKFAPDAASPKGTTGEGSIVWRPGPGGFSVIEDYESKRGSAKVTGLAVFWWDDATHGYRTIWCDTTNPGGCIDFQNVANWEGSQLVLAQEYESNGKKFTFKEVFGDITETGFTQTLYGGEAGGELKVEQMIQATKLTGGVPTGKRERK